jgi:hypothetical protein
LLLSSFDRKFVANHGMALACPCVNGERLFDTLVFDCLVGVNVCNFFAQVFSGLSWELRDSMFENNRWTDNRRRSLLGDS